jgi:GntR family transcriptional regulator
MASAILFHANPSSGVPLYRQLMEQVLLLVAGGRLAAGDFLPSVRQVAQELQVNPMTVSKAYSLLERDGIIELVRGTGMRVLPGQAVGSVRDRQRELAPLLEQVLARARQLDLGSSQVLDQLAHLFREHARG